MNGIKHLTTDLLEIGLIRRLVRLPFFQFLFVVPSLLIFIIAALSIFFGVRHAGSNFGMVFTWVVWWGMLVSFFVVLGRGWCVMCPFGALGEWVQRLSLWWKRKWGLGLNLKYPRRLKNMWFALVFFIVFIFMDNGYGISNSPPLTAGLIVVLVLGAIWVGLLFERRTFCLYHCPLTLFIGISSMFAPFEIRRKDAAVCRKCESKACFSGSERTYGCPMFEYQGRGMDKNNDCILCTECIKSCPHSNIGMRLRLWGHDLWARREGRLDESIGAVVIAALVTTVSLFLVMFLPPLKSLMDKILPAGAPPNDWPRVVSISLLYLGGVAASLLLMYGFSYLSKLFSGVKDVTAKSLFIHFGYAAVPLGIMKFLSDITDHVLRTWGAVFGVINALLQDFPLNRVMTEEITVKQVLSAGQTYLLQTVMIAIGFSFSLYVAYKLAERKFSDRDVAFRTFLPIGAFLFILTMAALWALSAAL
ncbi:MAG: 4Fe-4S binding protein [Chloroflexi bacterium]|nr:4Fe-4S binding protein [Chloroflexota bacterium]